MTKSNGELLDEYLGQLRKNASNDNVKFLLDWCGRDTERQMALSLITCFLLVRFPDLYGSTIEKTIIEMNQRFPILKTNKDRDIH